MKIKYRFEKQSAFTLAELLIALAVLGVIATFTIPKVLTAQQDQNFKAIAKEDIATISGAYQAYLQDTPAPPTTMYPKDLLPYINYVRITTSGASIDSYQNLAPASWPCTAGEPCATMHNGSVIFFRYPQIGGTSSTHALSFYIDPDGKVTDGTTNGPGKSIQVWLFYNGRIADCPNKGTTTDSAGTSGSCASSSTPPWFSWN